MRSGGTKGAPSPSEDGGFLDFLVHVWLPGNGGAARSAPPGRPARAPATIVRWPHTRVARRRALGTALARPYVGKIDKKLLRGPAPS